MDVFEWMADLCDQLEESGQSDLAQKIWDFDTLAHERRVDIVNALYPELLAASKSLGLPWLEVYVRHQQLSMRIGLGEGEKALSDTVELFELAHREENKSCPQSVCATQDLVHCYRRMDAPGYAQECQQVIEETLARIDPTWNCFQCLTVEWASLLTQLNRPEEAASYLLTQRQQVEKMKDDAIQTGLIAQQANAASLSGKFDEALAFVGQAERNETEPSDITLVTNAELKALILARAGRFEEALKEQPPFERAQEAPYFFEDWSETTELLINAGVQANDASIGQAFDEMFRLLEAGGAHYNALLIAERHVRLSLQRAAYWTAQRAFDGFERVKTRLRNAETAAEIHLKLRQLIEATPLPPMPVASDKLLSYLRDLPEGDPNSDIERAIPWLLTACTERPEDVDIHLIVASKMTACNAVDAADALLTAFTKRAPSVENVWYSLASLRLNGGNDAGVEQVIRDCASHLPSVSVFAKAALAYKQERYEDCIEASQQMLAITPDAPNTRRRMGWAAQRLGNHDLAIEQFSVLAAASEEAGSDDWDLLISATVLSNQELIHRCCERLELSVEPGSMPAVWKDGERSICRLIYKDAQGRHFTELAERLGPVSARIIEVENPDAEQAYQDLVVFDSRLLNQYPEDPGEQKNWCPNFAHMHTLTKGGYRSWVIDGVYPGEKTWAEFYAALRERGWGVWIATGDDYLVTDPGCEEDEELPGVAAFVAVPHTTPPTVAAEALTQLTKDWPHPLCWLALANEAGHDLERHTEISQRYNL